MNNKEKRVVFCDAGGVVWPLIDMDKWWSNIYFKSAWGTTKEFNEAKKIALKIAWEPFERGEINPGEFRILFQRILGLIPMRAAAFWNLYVDIVKEINAPLIECLWKMRECGIVLALLSNLDAKRHRYICEKRSDEYKTITAPFHYLFFSCNVHSRKPEPEIYRHAFKKVSALPQNAYYIEDYPRNIDGMTAAIPCMPRENMLLYRADRHDEEAAPFFRRHDLIG